MGPEWTTAVPTNRRVNRKPKLKLGPTAQDGAAVSSAAVQQQTAASGHNVFRPDIYRVSEGYLN